MPFADGAGRVPSVRNVMYKVQTMSTTKTKPKSKIKKLPPRSAVKTADTWDLASLFPNDNAWEKAFTAWEKQIDGYEKSFADAARASRGSQCFWQRREQDPALGTEKFVLRPSIRW